MCSSFERKQPPRLGPLSDYYPSISEPISPCEPGSPHDGGGPPPSNSCVYNCTAAGDYYPLGLNCSDNKVNADPTGTVVYYRPGLSVPVTPNPAFRGDWNFGCWNWPSCTCGTGGIGTVDGAAAGFSNTLRFIVVGNGILSVTTVSAQSIALPLVTFQVNLDRQTTVGNYANFTQTVVGTYTAGDIVTVTITDAAERCVSHIDLTAWSFTGANSRLGWSSMNWRAFCGL